MDPNLWQEYKSLVRHIIIIELQRQDEMNDFVHSQLLRQIDQLRTDIRNIENRVDEDQKRLLRIERKRMCEELNVEYNGK